MHEVDVYGGSDVPPGFCRVFAVQIGAWKGHVVDSREMHAVSGGAVVRHRQWITHRLEFCEVPETDFFEIPLHPVTGNYMFPAGSGVGGDVTPVVRGRPGRRRKTYLLRIEAAIGISSRENSDPGRAMFKALVESYAKVFALTDVAMRERVVNARAEGIASLGPLAIDRPEVKSRSVFDDAEVTTTLRRYVASKGLTDADVHAVTLAGTEQMAVRRCSGQMPILRWVGFDPDGSLSYRMSDLDLWWEMEGIPVWLRASPAAALMYIACTPGLPPAYRSQDVLRRIMTERDRMRYLERFTEVPL